MNIKAQKLKGFQDYPPKVMKLRLEIMDLVRQIAATAGFSPMGTPALEYAEVLLGVGGETDKQVFRFLDNGDRQVALRFDLTVPFARYVAEHQGQMIFPFKRMQIGDVWRAEKPQKGRYREFCQCDLDVIGTDSVLAEVDILWAFTQILDRLAIGRFSLSMNHRGILEALLDDFFPERTQEESTQIMIAVDKLDKIGPEGVLKLLVEQSFSEHKCQKLVELLGSRAEDMEAYLKKISSEKGQKAMAELKALLSYSETMNFPKSVSFQLNFKIVRGLGYYTGVIFETVWDTYPELGSVCSGGRYEGLVSRFSHNPLSGVGASLGLDRLVSGMMEKIPEPDDSTLRQQGGVFIALASEDPSYALRILGSLRQIGIATDLNIKPAKLASQFKFASRKCYRFVLVVGDEEEKKESVTIKNMVTGEEKKDVLWKELEQTLQRSLKPSPEDLWLIT